MTKIGKSVTMLFLSCVILGLPLVLLFISGEAPHDLDGELDHERPAFTVGGFFQGDFQIQFEDWFNTRHPLRPEIIEFYGVLDAGKDRLNLLGLVMENDDDEPAGFRGTDQVIIGRNGWLFENSYINEFFGFSDRYQQVTDEQLRQRAEMLRDIQDELHNRGIAFTVLITPSKAFSLLTRRSMHICS